MPSGPFVIDKPACCAKEKKVLVKSTLDTTTINTRDVTVRFIFVFISKGSFIIYYELTLHAHKRDLRTNRTEEGPLGNNER